MYIKQYEDTPMGGMYFPEEEENPVKKRIDVLDSEFSINIKKPACHRIDFECKLFLNYFTSYCYILKCLPQC